MKIVRTLAAYIASLAATYFFSVAFFTQQVIAKAAAVGAVYTPGQQLQAFQENFYGLAFRDPPSLAQPSFGITLAVAITVGFAVAFVVKRILKPLAPVAYPVAGAAAVFALLTFIESTVAGGGVGAIGGARDMTGLLLQALAGFLGGGLFAVLRPR
ncbi:MAG: hypothetical protein R3C42_09770 [Parvularculaceae bacterium]